MVLLLFYVLVTGCENKAEEGHKIRVKNDFPTPLCIKIGPSDFNQVETKELTEYKRAYKGENQVSGEVSATITLEGEGMVYWTLTIDENLQPIIEQD
jgi:hypothetical protein